LTCGRFVWLTCDIFGRIDNLVVAPAGRKLGFPGFAGSVPVSATSFRIAVEYVRPAFGRNTDRLQIWTVLGIEFIPAESALARVIRFVLAIAALM
jgi:hypothetical protein